MISDDVALFRSAIGDVKPLRDRNRNIRDTNPSKHLPQPKAENHAIRASFTYDHQKSSLSSSNDMLEYFSNGVSRKEVRKFKRTENAIQARLDLHGHSIENARSVLLHFIRRVTQQGLRCVLVIHGKGNNSLSGEGILRRYSRLWLAQHPVVLAFSEAPAKEGGSGAVIVLLRNTASRNAG